MTGASETTGASLDARAEKHPRIVIDGLIFQFARTGVPRVWISYLKQWASSDFASHLIVLDRGKTAPRVSGITYFDIPAFEGDNRGGEMLRVEELCRELQADVFVSTFYSTPIGTRSVMMAYDMIYELQQQDARKGWEEEEKPLAILHANHIVAISHKTAEDVRKFYPHLSEKDFSVVHCGVDPIFHPATEDRITSVKEKFGVKGRYFLLVGTRKGFRGYKNAIFLFRSLEKMKTVPDFEVICVGGEPTLEELSSFQKVSARLLPHVPEEDLVPLYSGAEALVYPSRYEGFGLPIIEAMACGCPVITCPNGSIPEVAGDAALFVDNDDDAGMEAALLKVGDPLFRAELKARGLARAALFSWKKAADQLAQILSQATTLPEKPAHEIRIWQQFREQEQRLALLTKMAQREPKAPRRRLEFKLGSFRFLMGISRE